MPKIQTQIEIGNLVVKFGEQHNLLDLFTEVVAPAFFDPTLKRSYSDTTYLFYESQLVTVLGEPVIVGRLVKDTVLEREQLLVNGELTVTTGTLPSSPSSLFVLLLSCHRLLFVRQHRGSPSLDNFRTTLSRFLKQCHRSFLQAKSNQVDPETGEKSKLKDLVARFPYPTVDLTPLASNDSIHTFLKKFKLIETVTAHLLDTNSEIDNDGMFKALRASQARMRSKRTSVHYENKPKGLSKSETESQLSVLAKQGNHAMKVVGYDSAGEKIEGNNDSFKVKIPIADLSENLKTAAQSLVQRFNGLKENKIITVPDADPQAVEKAKEVRQAFES
jgi:hypothetical protein